MTQKPSPARNYQQTMQAIGYVPRKEASQADYDRIGFMSGLEVHQQLKTDEKLFCRCPAGIYQGDDAYDAEVIRHMRPTLSELGEYDGTALMEFKTRKNIVYRIKNETTCTYEVDDTPPFPINRKAVDIAIEISLLKKLNIVGEIHITRKQYLDGSIPTGFQRTAIIGVEGAIALKNKTVRLIQLSLEEDSCREISDVGHWRTYKTDRLGMPLIETVTYPDMVNPDEVAEACQVIRFLNRSTDKVRVGIGSARQDVNVSCRGGTRVEIKGVSHIKWIPELTHNEAFRQWALLHIREILNQRIDPGKWQMHARELDPGDFPFRSQVLQQIAAQEMKLYGVRLPHFDGLLSHFTQPAQVFADEISDRLKVVACIEKPNMDAEDSLWRLETSAAYNRLREVLDARSEDAVLFFWGPEDDIATALETIEERCRMAFDGVPNETRKSFPDGTTMFERVLPGADRMYPDTDSPPIPLLDEDIERLGKDLPTLHNQAWQTMSNWGVPEDTYTYIFRNNLFPLIQQMVEEDGEDPVFAATLFGHRLKFVEGQYDQAPGFHYGMVAHMLRALREKGIPGEVMYSALPALWQYAEEDPAAVLDQIGYSPLEKTEVLAVLPELRKTFARIRLNGSGAAEADWLMGKLRPRALGNIPLNELKREIDARLGKEVRSKK